MSQTGYTPVGDVLSLALSVLLVVLINTAYVTKKKTFRIFQIMLVMEMVAAISDMIYHMLLSVYPIPRVPIYLFRALQHTALYLLMWLFFYYLQEILHLPKKTRRHYFSISGLAVLIAVGTDAFLTLSGKGFLVDASGIIKESGWVFAVFYAFFIFLIFFLLIRYRARMVPQISRGLFLTFLFCLIIHGIQGLHHQSSFTTAIYILPIIALMYLLHSNPYEMTTGAVNEESFQDTIAEAYKKKQKLMLMFLHLLDFESYNSFTEDLQFEIFRFFTGIVKKGTLFRVAGGRLALVFREADNPEMAATSKRVEDDFYTLYERYQIPFKVVIMESDDDISENADYNKFLLFMEERIPLNTYYHVTGEDKALFKQQQMILTELEDIAEKGDLEDPRVLVYCQPVYHVRTQMYDTAEALMRLDLPALGLVYPDQVVPLAEENRLIHPLSLIILNKTCREIRRLLEEGFIVSRISVNFAVQELYDRHFCEDILKIIRQNNIDCEKIAIELTESQNTADFEIVKSRIEELQQHGIKFYLDDFGTGYSNVERIMELPFDIIKFDRSLVIESSKSEHSAYMVNTFADMFRHLDYRVLYEGVEDDNDEERCIRMYAQYLQGFKYSRPIAIERLREFLTKAA